jgi:hypothetical protein
MKQLALLLLLLTLFTTSNKCKPSDYEPSEIGKLYDLCLTEDPKKLYKTLLTKSFSDPATTIRAATILFEAHPTPHPNKVTSAITSLKKLALINQDKNMRELTVP